jgi:TRAP-type C4-dicarboxylate transport system permease small subunit
MNQFITKLENFLIVVCMLGALGIGTIQVVLRYVFNTGMVWIELTVVTLTILGALVGASRAIVKDVHIRITMLTDQLPFSVQRYFEVAAIVVALIYSVFLAYVGLLYVQFLHMMGTVSAEADIPVWIIYSIVPFCMVLFIYRYFQCLPRAWKAKDNVDIKLHDKVSKESLL